MKKIDRNSIKIGDVVGVCQQSEVGWCRSFRYAKTVPMKIKRITPSRTKIVMENGIEYDRYESFYEMDEDALNETHVAECAEKLTTNLNKLDKLDNEGFILTKSDKTIIAVCDLLSQIMDKIENDTDLSCKVNISKTKFKEYLR